MAPDDEKEKRPPRKRRKPAHSDWRDATVYFPDGAGESSAASPVMPIEGPTLHPNTPKYDLNPLRFNRSETPAEDGPFFADSEEGFPLPEAERQRRDSQTPKPRKGAPEPGTGEELDLDA